MFLVLPFFCNSAIFKYLTGYLNKLSYALVDAFHIETLEKANVKLLKAATEPFTQYVIKVDTSIITQIALNKTDPDTSLIKVNCGKGNDTEAKCKSNKPKTLKRNYSKDYRNLLY